MKPLRRTPIILACLPFLILVFLSCNPRSQKTGPAALPGHPRLILSGDFLELTRERCRGARAPLFAALKESVDRYSPGDRDSIPVREAGRLAEKCGFIYLVEGDTRYLEKGLEYLGRALERYIQLEREHGGGYWEAVEFRRYCCFAYDWLYGGMSELQRRELGEKIAGAGRIAWDKEWFTPYGGGGYGTLDPVFWPAVTLAGTGVDDSLSGEWFAWTTEKIHEWRKMMDQVAADDGGMYSGLAYAAYNYVRTPVYDFEIWKALTGEDLAENNPYLRWFSLWWTWCVKPNGEWPRIDDAGSVKGSIQPWHFKYLASRYHDPLSLWNLARLKEPASPTVWDVIWGPAELGISPAGPDSTWPLARHFEGLGWVVMRSGWDSTASYAIFDCGDFYYGHQHPAENAFTIFKQGSLAINSGRYEWESNHRPNYMARTIAGNTLLVYDPREKFSTEGGDTLSNDGGQVWPRPGRESFGPTKGTQWDTGDITAFETNRYYSYVCGDASRAYSPHKLSLFTRQFLQLQPDLFLIFDRVVTTRPEYKKYWIMHTIDEPLLNGSLVTVTERGGKLFCRTVLPAAAKVTKVGGPGHEFEIFGTNFPPKMVYYSLSEGEEWGSWRLQVTPGQARTADCFLNVLLAADSSATAPPEVDGLALDSDLPGVRINYNSKIYEVYFNRTGASGGKIRIASATGAVILDQPLADKVQPQAGIGN
ncbi:MAG: hypothetical protein A3F83_00395 [Candidatus Glassbacteria bacterium RIFCSPLOWO2_12_FULL_58_11]|uniref:Heparinase II/III-like C-terminal domain-containing protein n=1 Tax=Candidatus Glassbacteria bacterium RIFCSPLOWO2_12_FULL_58_11 TaxID=1817867 RepID=A0A1F5YP29_9BACT|nr:MAG: hypothetical protein A3F83_00395 [Candidatus Glassbacteria bacterium RIFCSPLOWO2_12_FULL_58_11]